MCSVYIDGKSAIVHLQETIVVIKTRRSLFPSTSIFSLLLLGNYQVKNRHSNVAVNEGEVLELLIMASIRHLPRDVASTKILTYLQQHNYDDCAVYIHRLNSITFRKILTSDISIDILLAQLPFSIEVLEVIYSKIFIYDSEGFPLKILKPERLISRMISLLASSIRYPTKGIGIDDDDERIMKNLSSILRIISCVQPVLFKRLLRQRETIDLCILHFEQIRSKSSIDFPLKSLEENIRHELESTILCCQQALHRLDSSARRSSSPVPSLTPHIPRKRSSIVSLSSSSPNSFEEIQNRLYHHQSILNLIEPYLSRTKLYSILDNLQEKVSLDKEILLAYSHIKTHEKQLLSGEPLLPLFKRFALAYERECGKSIK